MSGNELEPFDAGIDADVELAWLVDPPTPPPSAAELARQVIRRGLPLVVEGLVSMAVSAESEKIRLEASRYVVQLAGLLGVAEVGASGLDELLDQFRDEGPAAA
jgi:hypothetical protein